MPLPQKQPSELTVITKAKDLSKLIYTVTLKSPKQFRFTLSSRLQSLSSDIIEDLFYANEVFVGGPDAKAQFMVRLEYQRSARTKLHLLAYYAEFAAEQKAILFKQYEQIAEAVFACLNMVSAWIRSDKKRWEKA